MQVTESKTADQVQLSPDDPATHFPQPETPGSPKNDEKKTFESVLSDLTEMHGEKTAKKFVKMFSMMLAEHGNRLLEYDEEHIVEAIESGDVRQLAGHRLRMSEVEDIIDLLERSIPKHWVADDDASSTSG